MGAERKMANTKLLLLVLVAVLAVATAQRNNNRFNNNNRNNNNRFNNNRNNNRNNNGRAIDNNNRNNNGRAINNRPQQSTNRNPIINGGSFRATPSNARDRSGHEVYPGCNGTVCLPLADLCARRKNKPGHFTFVGKSYWVSWASDESNLRNARWNWFTGRNYCR